jgi:hypothetical protein
LKTNVLAQCKIACKICKCKCTLNIKPCLFKALQTKMYFQKDAISLEMICLTFYLIASDWLHLGRVWVGARMSNWRGRRPNTTDLLINVACLVHYKYCLHHQAQLISTSWYKEVNCTEPFPSGRLPWWANGQIQTFKHSLCQFFNSRCGYALYDRAVCTQQQNGLT